ncbi:MAG: alanine racemase [Desulfovibrionaceae bacterium]
MSIDYNAIDVLIHLENIRANWRLLNARSGRAWPVVKADAYGHGLIEVARALSEEGADTFCIGTPGEGAKLRRSGHTARIVSLTGAIAPGDYDLLWDYDIIPFVAGFEHLEALAAQAAGRRKPLPVSLKFDTGMSRLGFTRDDLPALAERLHRLPGIVPALVSSHLATSDEPNQLDFMDRQADTFDAIVSYLKAEGFDVEANLANSAAILAHARTHYAAQRAGIAMYGCNPFHGTAMAHHGQGLRPAMEVSAPILHVHTLPKGESVSYGRTYKAEQDMRVAIVAVGYADGYSRGLSNTGWMCVNGRRVPIVGRVCMQLTAVDVSALEGGPDAAHVGQRAWLLGGEGPGRISPEDLAGWWSTITYEAFCLLGMNPRRYV